MPRKKRSKGVDSETLFSKLQKEKDAAQARYEIEKSAALTSNFSSKLDEVETP